MIGLGPNSFDEGEVLSQRTVIGGVWHIADNHDLIVDLEIRTKISFLVLNRTSFFTEVEFETLNFQPRLESEFIVAGRPWRL